MYSDFQSTFSNFRSPIFKWEHEDSFSVRGSTPGCISTTYPKTFSDAEMEDEYKGW